MILDDIARLAVEHAYTILLLAVGFWLAYSRYGHGLHRFPGPFMGSFTSFWRVWNGLFTSRDEPMVLVHREFGDIVRLSPKSLSFGHPEAIRDIYGPQGLDQKADMYTVPTPTSQGAVVPSLFGNIDKVWHDNVRRRINSAFSMSALVKYEPYVDNIIDEFLREIDRRFCDTPSQRRLIDLPKWLQYFSFDVIGELTYGKRHGFLEKGDDIGGIIGNAHKMLLYSFIILQWPVLDKVFYKNPILMWLNKYGLFNKVDPIIYFAMEHQTNRKRILDNMKASGELSDRGTLTDRFIKANEEYPETVTPGDVLSLGLDMVFAGSETTAITLGAIFYYVLKNGPCYARLQSEIDSVTTKATANYASVPFSTAHELPYLQAVIKESFRMHPAARWAPERLVPEAGTTICGHFIPGGTTVGVNAWVIHRRTDIFGNDANQFRPERWLEEGGSSPEKIKEMERNLLQFGYGKYICIGKNISLLEMYKLVPAVLSNYHLSLAHLDQDWSFSPGAFVNQKDFFVRAKRR